MLLRREEKEYIKRAFNYRGGRFHNQEEFSMMKRAPKDKKNEFLSVKDKVPKQKLPLVDPRFLTNPEEEDLTVTWFGHSSVMLQMEGKNIIIDPVFSKRVSPVFFAGPKRFSNPPLAVKELPEIDFVVISHNHYDHLDKATILKVDRKVKNYIVSLGVEKILHGWGIEDKKIKSLAWWEDVTLDTITFTSTPGRHFSGRGINDWYKTLWCSWVLTGENHQVFLNGDSGYGEHYKEIKDRFGAFDLALMELGQYDVAWPEVHMTPEQSYKAATELSAKMILPIHWAAFKLANHPWDDSVERLLKAAGEKQDRIVTPRIGETINIKNAPVETSRWWREIM